MAAAASRRRQMPGRHIRANAGMLSIKRDGETESVVSPQQHRLSLTRPQCRISSALEMTKVIRLAKWRHLSQDESAERLSASVIVAHAGMSPEIASSDELLMLPPNRSWLTPYLVSSCRQRHASASKQHLCLINRHHAIMRKPAIASIIVGFNHAS